MFISCEKDKVKSNENIKVTDGPTNQIVYADETEGEGNVTFTVTGMWISEITEGENATTAIWVSIDPAHGDIAGSYTINLTLEPNYSGEKRTATITITCDGESITITITQDAKKADGTTLENPAFTDDGVVINGIMWATRNVDTPGTFAANPESYGMFYQWNSQVAYPTDDKIISQSKDSYSYSHWTTTNDPCPAGWSVPDDDNIKKLLDSEKVGSEWTSVNGVNGRKFTDNTTDASLFLPAAGYRYQGTLYGTGLEGHYWSSVMITYSRPGEYFYYIFSLDFVSDRVDWVSKGYYDNCNIRCVAEDETSALLTVSSEAYYFAANGGTSSDITVASNKLWTVSSSSSWLTTSPTSGNKDGTFTITAAENTSTSLRDATVTVTVGNEIERTIWITQGGTAPLECVVINGVGWATCNVGAVGTFTAKPEDAGMFYQWGSKVEWSSTDPLINSECGATWCCASPRGDDWEKNNNPCPPGWRVPYLQDIFKLLDASNEWTTVNGANGRKFTDNTTDASIFLPAAGYRNSDGSLSWASEFGYYWIDTRSSKFNTPYFLYFDSDRASWEWSEIIHECDCLSVRCVLEYPTSAGM